MVAQSDGWCCVEGENEGKWSVAVSPFLSVVVLEQSRETRDTISLASETSHRHVIPTLHTRRPVQLV